MKVIFLDIDGVLVGLEYLRTLSALKIPNVDEYGYEFDPRCVRNLEYILKESPGTKIVLSSTWRYMGLAKVLKMWKSRKLPGEIVGLTPNLTREGEGEITRGMEIQEWLTKCRHEEVSRYIIIDDDGDMLPEQTDVFIHTASHHGIRFDDCRKAIDLLNR